MQRLLIGCFALALPAVMCAFASAQQPSASRPYDGIQAGLDAYRLGEERRRSDFQQQMDVNDDLRAWSGLPGSIGQTTWYRPPLRPAVNGNLDAMYGYGYGSPYGIGRYGGYGYQSAGYGPGLGVSTVFEPWPYVPGNIWASKYVTPYRQPVGRWEGQTGENRWESHPVYDPPITPFAPSPPVDSPWLDRTPYATPRQGLYEWRSGEVGLPDHEFPADASPKGAANGVTEELLPPPPEADGFDTPREVRETPSAPAVRRRRGVREF
jgi:hypothetical protein